MIYSSDPDRGLVSGLVCQRRKQGSGVCFHRSIYCVCWPLSSPDGSYTEEQSAETQVKAVANRTSCAPESDDEFDELETIGTCKALYTFEGISSPA